MSKKSGDLGKIAHISEFAVTSHPTTHLEKRSLRTLSILSNDSAHAVRKHVGPADGSVLRQEEDSYRCCNLQGMVRSLRRTISKRNIPPRFPSEESARPMQRQTNFRRRTY